MVVNGGFGVDFMAATDGAFFEEMSSFLLPSVPSENIDDTKAVDAGRIVVVQSGYTIQASLEENDGLRVYYAGPSAKN